MTKTKQALPKIVSQPEWQTALDEQIKKEKELTRLSDALSAQRRKLPMVKVDKVYDFESKQDRLTLLELFDNRRQLIVYHFMFAPDWSEGCPGCSWVVDAMSHPAHLHARDTSIVLVSRTSVDNIEAYKKRMGWDFPWYSSFESDFNYDFNATTDDGEEHGVSVFVRSDQQIYQSYHTGARGVEHLGSHWTYLDLTPYGRQETWEDSPKGWPQTLTYGWQRRHDDYDS